jgi:hypothetical protein
MSLVDRALRELPEFLPADVRRERAYRQVENELAHPLLVFRRVTTYSASEDVHLTIHLNSGSGPLRPLFRIKFRGYGNSPDGDELRYNLTGPGPVGGSVWATFDYRYDAGAVAVALAEVIRADELRQQERTNVLLGRVPETPPAESLVEQRTRDQERGFDL